jgi:type VI secretion system protein ImpA
MINVENLVAAISPDAPCGPDLTSTERFRELETTLQGKPDIEMGSIKRPAEPPDWRVLQDQCLAYLEASKDLRALMMLLCSCIHTAGLPGFAASLKAVRAVVEQHWPSVHPILDPEDPDPIQRLNILRSLTLERAPGPPWLQILDALATVPLCRPKGASPPTLELVHAQARARANGDPISGPNVQDLFQSVSKEEIAANHRAIVDATDSVKGIDAFLLRTLGSHGAISFEELSKILNQIERILEPHAGAAASTAEASTAQTPASAGAVSIPEANAAAASPRQINNPNDVIHALNQILNYYEKIEPSSPVPYLLRRAQKLAMMNFVDSLVELQISTVDNLKSAMGSVVETQPTTPP